MASAPKRSNEPIFWSLFSAGGVVSALVGPALVVLIGFSGILGIGAGLEHAHFQALVSSTLVRVALLPVIALPMFHWAHRFRFVMVDLGLRPLKTPLAIVCYAVAIGVTGWAGWVLLAPAFGLL